MGTITITTDGSGDVTAVAGEEAFQLAATSQINITVTIPAAARPYLEQWYAAKGGGNTVNDFVLKLLLRNALQYRYDQLKAAGGNALRQAKAIEDTDYEADYEAAKTALGL